MRHYRTKCEKVSMSSLKCEYIFSYGQRRNISFLKTAHWYDLSFLYLFIRPGNLNLKIPENLAVLTFLREKVSTFAQSKWYMYTLWLLIRRHSRSTFAQNSRFLILPLCFQLLFFEVLVLMLGMEVTVAWWKFVILKNEIRDTHFAMPQLCFDFFFFRYLKRCVSTGITATICSTTATYLDFFVIF